MMKSWNASRGRDRGTNSFRGGARGGSNHGFRSRSGGQQKRGGNRANIQCHNCEGFGHYQRECASEKRSQLNYVEEGEEYNECVDDNAEGDDVDHSAYLYCVLPTSKSYVEPLKMDDSLIQKDLDFVLTAGKVDTKLPLYNALVNGYPCSVLIDSGASANYISPTLLSAVTQVRSVKGQAVETANGHQSVTVTYNTVRMFCNFSFTLSLLAR
jgi:hypothetical protein